MAGGGVPVDDDYREEIDSFGITSPQNSKYSQDNLNYHRPKATR